MGALRRNRFGGGAIRLQRGFRWLSRSKVTKPCHSSHFLKPLFIGFRLAVSLTLTGSQWPATKWYHHLRGKLPIVDSGSERSPSVNVNHCPQFEGTIKDYGPLICGDMFFMRTIALMVNQQRQLTWRQCTWTRDHSVSSHLRARACAAPSVESTDDR